MFIFYAPKHWSKVLVCENLLGHKPDSDSDNKHEISKKCTYSLSFCESFEDNVLQLRKTAVWRILNDLLSRLCAVHSLLKSSFNTVAIEKEKIKQILSDQEQSDQSAQINSLRKSLSQVMSCLQPLPMMPLSFYYKNIDSSLCMWNKASRNTK